MLRRLVILVCTVLLLLFVVLISLSGSFDVELAIEECEEGGTVTIPSGEFTIEATLVLKDNVTIRGSGIDRTILRMTPRAEATPLVGGDGVTGSTISDLTLASSTPKGNVFAVWISNYSAITLERVKATGCMYALKADTFGSDLQVHEFIARDCGQTYISNLQGGTFSDLDIEATTEGIAETSFHALYLGTNNHGLRFTNVRAVGGSGYTVHMYCSGLPPADDITFDGLTVEGRWAVVVDNVTNVTLTNVNATATATDAPVFSVRSGPFRVDGFQASGGSSLVGVSTTETVVFRNGTYQGETLYDGNQDANLHLENVAKTGPPAGS